MSVSALIAHKAFGPIAGAIAIVSIAANGVLAVSLYAERRHAGKLETQVEAIAGDLRTCRSNEFSLESALNAQSAAIRTLALSAEKAAAEAKAAQAAAEPVAREYERAAGRIASAKPTHADPCTAAAELIRETLARELNQ